MEKFVAENPGVVLWMLGGLVPIFALLFGIIQHLYRRDEQHKVGVIESLTSAIGELKESFLEAANKITEWMHHTDNRLTKLETEHKLITKAKLGGRCLESDQMPLFKNDQNYPSAHP